MRYYDYKIADVSLRSEYDLVELGIRGFAPFACEVEGDCDSYFVTSEKVAQYAEHSLKQLSESYLAEADAQGILYKTANGYLYRITPCGNEGSVIEFSIDTTTMRFTTNMFDHEVDVAILRFGLWII